MTLSHLIAKSKLTASRKQNYPALMRVSGKTATSSLLRRCHPEPEPEPEPELEARLLSTLGNWEGQLGLISEVLIPSLGV
jgi:hypothetical protein